MTSLDLDRAAETFAAATDFTVGVEEEFSILDPRHARTRAALRGAARRAPTGASPLLHEHITGELISSEIEIISGVGGDLQHALGRQRERRQAPVRARRRAGRRARRDRHPPVGRLPRAADHRHRALPPRRGRPEVRGLAQQHLQPARAPRRARHRPRDPRLRPPAPGAAAATRRSPPTRPSSTVATAACTRRARRASRRASRAAAFPTRSAAGPPTASTSSSSCARSRSSSSRRSGGRCARTSASAPSRCGSATCRRTAQESDALASLIAACIAQAARDVDEGVPFDDPAPRLIEENMWRAIRFGLDGRLIDLERGEEYPARAGDRAARRLDRAGARGARDRARPSPSATAPSASAR